MPYPMIPGTIKERWEKSIENTIGLPIDLIRKMDSTHMSFYLQNKDKITVKESDKGIFFFVSDKNLKDDIYQKIYETEPVKTHREFVFDEDSLDKYLKIIDFRGPEINTNPIRRYITSEEINKEMDKYFKDNSKN